MDVLLQGNGNRILRFLAEDAGARFDKVLDAILRALANQQSHPSD
jgi:very-short-patch-repair endonuclease